MSLKREAYEALKNVVGPENISEDPAVIQSYMLQVAFGSTLTKFIPAALEAVTLPKSTEEVQAIVKICSRYKVKFKAHSTGWGIQGIPLREGSILLDLRRMDKIIKIDEKNMYAVIDPYVTARELQVEAMKKGLTCHVIGAGSQHSVLASATSGWGMGVTANTMSHNSRNLLGFEWVTPTGEIVTTGPVEDGKLGDAGPSLRGVIRGYSGHVGGLGVFTKCAVKLYPWPGQAVPEVVGLNPRYGWKIPENIKIYMLKFPSWEKLSDACYKLNEEEITYILWSYSPNNLILAVTPTNNDYQWAWEQLEEVGQIEANRYPLQLMIVADSRKELEYKEKVLGDILGETGAEDCLPQFFTKETRELMYALFITQYAHGMIFRATSEFGSSYGTYITWDDNMKAAKSCAGVRSKYIEEGKFTNDGFENMWGGPEEQYTYGHNEGLFLPNPADPESMKASLEYIGESDQEVLKQKLMGSLTIPLVVEPGPLVPKDLISKVSNYYIWSKKITDVFDPENLSEGTAYLELTELTEDMARALGAL